MTYKHKETIHSAYIGLGSNIQDPAKQVKLAFNLLSKHPNINLIKKSSIYQSAPVGPQDQPDFLNAVCKITTQLKPIELLETCQQFEKQQGRTTHRRWGERSIDYDILLYDNMQQTTEVLTLPHPELLQRLFVLYPLQEIAPTLQLPNGEHINNIIKSLPPCSVKKIHAIEAHAVKADDAP